MLFRELSSRSEGRRRPGPPRWPDQKLAQPQERLWLITGLSRSDSHPGRRRSRRPPRLEEDTASAIVADHYRFVVGVDTHAATHSYAVVESPTGRIIDQATFPTTTAGLARARAWIDRRAGGGTATVLIAAEGTGSDGAIAADRLERAGYRVVEAPTPSAKQLRPDATERTRTVNTLTALIRSYDLGIDARRALSTAQITEVASWQRRLEY